MTGNEAAKMLRRLRPPTPVLRDEEAEANQLRRDSYALADRLEALYGEQEIPWFSA